MSTNILTAHFPFLKKSKPIYMTIFSQLSRQYEYIEAALVKVYFDSEDYKTKTRK